LFEWNFLSILDPWRKWFWCSVGWFWTYCYKLSWYINLRQSHLHNPLYMRLWAIWLTIFFCASQWLAVLFQKIPSLVKSLHVSTFLLLKGKYLTALALIHLVYGRQLIAFCIYLKGYRKVSKANWLVQIVLKILLFLR